MKLLFLFTAFFSLLGLSAAQSSPMPVVACTPTGAGTCNLGVAGLVTKNAGVTWNWLRIYNNACQEIGGITGTFVNYLPVGVTSQLPYVLILDYLNYKDYNNMAFRYAAHSFSGTPYCRRTNFPDGSVIHTCQSAFPC